MVTKSPGAYGRVVDARSYRSVANAQVSFPMLRVPAAITDSEGRFDLPYEEKLGIVVLLPFEFQNTRLQVVHPGYEPYSTLVFISDSHGRHDVFLQPRSKP
jgi:hypothetical protein